MTISEITNINTNSKLLSSATTTGIHSDYLSDDNAPTITVIPAHAPGEKNPTVTSPFKLRVAAYCRVSTNDSDQKNSYDMQIHYYRTAILQHPDWMLVRIYADEGKPVIVPKEAEIIRRIYTLFASDNSMGEIAKLLTTDKIPRKNGATVWGRKNVEMILTNEKYAGFAILQKTVTTDCLTHSRAKNTGQKPMYVVNKCHEAIISPELYDKVQQEFVRRRNERFSGYDKSEPDNPTDINALSEIENCDLSKIPTLPKTVSTKRRQYSLSRLLICQTCGHTFRRVIWRSNGHKYAVYRCGARLEGGKDYCPDSPALHEDELRTQFWDLVKSRIPNVESEISPKSTPELVDYYLEKYIDYVLVASKTELEIRYR